MVKLPAAIRSVVVVVHLVTILSTVQKISVASMWISRLHNNLVSHVHLHHTCFLPSNSDMVLQIAVMKKTGPPIARISAHARVGRAEMGQTNGATNVS